MPDGGTVEVIEPLHGRQRLRRQGCRGPSHELRQPLVLRHVLSGGARRAYKDGVVFCDSYTGFLFTGDLIFPGKINISNDKDYVASLARLQHWKRTR